MTHLPHLILDLGLILMGAAVVTLIFKKLNQPVVLGYLIAGFLVSPHTAFLPSVQDTQSVSIWAEIGVIFMLFGLGLEFSFKKLARVGKSAAITAAFEISAMLGIGYILGQLLGWSKMDSLFLGGILSISSTTIIVRAFAELGLKGRNFVSLVFGVLIVEDLIAILLLVLLSSVAVTQSLSGIELLYSSLKLVFFLLLWFLLGIYLLPIFLRRFNRLLADETLLIVSIGLCLMMVVFASKVGFSPALGAFVMGSILAETPFGHRVERVILPVKDLFSAIFFVSVGMLINPGVIGEHLGVILVITAATALGKLLSTSVGALVSGRSLKHSVQAGMSLAQIGEFSFIIATLGLTLKVTSDFLYPVAVAVSAITTFLTPYLIRLADPLYAEAEKRLSPRIKESLTRYESAMSTSSGGSLFSLLWREYGVKILLNSVIVVAIALAMSQLIGPGEGHTQYWACAGALLLSTPFFWAVFFGGPQRPAMRLAEAVETVDKLRRLQWGVRVIRAVIGVLLVSVVISRFFALGSIAGILFLGLAAIGAFFLNRFSKPVYHRIEARFLSNLTENERLELAKKASLPELAPWSAQLGQFTLSPESEFVGKALADSGIKEKYGITVAMIERGSKRILAPTRFELLMPTDILYLVGTDDQLNAVRERIEFKPKEEELPAADTFGLMPLSLQKGDLFVGKPIRECGLREAVQGLIVGIEREGTRILNPESSMRLLPGDLVWIVGNRALVRALRDR